MTLQIHWQDGCLISSDPHGLGVEFDEEAARALPPPPIGRGRALWRDDGSLTNR